MNRIGSILLVAGFGIAALGGNASAQCRGGGMGQGGTGASSIGTGLVTSNGLLATPGNPYASQLMLAQLQQQYLLQQQQLFAQQQYLQAQQQQQSAARQATLASRTARAEQTRTQIAAKRQADTAKRLAANAALGRSPATLLASYRPGQ